MSRVHGLKRWFPDVGAILGGSGNVVGVGLAGADGTLVVISVVIAGAQSASPPSLFVFSFPLSAACLPRSKGEP